MKIKLKVRYMAPVSVKCSQLNKFLLIPVCGCGGGVADTDVVVAASGTAF